MCLNNKELKREEEKVLLSSLAVEVDTIFLKLRKADQVIRHELSLLDHPNIQAFEKSQVEPINVEQLKKIIYKIPPQHLLVDEYVLYMLDSKTTSIFGLVEDYNHFLERRQKLQHSNDQSDLKNVDENLVYAIRRLGAMIYHLNIHLNLLTVLLVKAPFFTNHQQITINESKDKSEKKLLDDWDKWHDNVRFLEITIDEPYAIVTWAMEELGGDAILQHEQGNWQLMTISTSRFDAKAFEPVNISSDAAQRLLKRHYQKLGF
ncbi:MAG: hypothetical protein RID53_14300 [Coleofasciculus sp. B1-GNL1-01]|uniref:hypothetical protein n=1 Tax=Coleofasciculus sp. B1-GNL1-01 TaxID=3068484 RepID=UPI0032F80F8C